MRRVHLAELRDSWSAWLGVSLAFIMVNATIALTVIIGYTGVAATLDGRLNLLSSTSWTLSQAMVLVFILFTAIPVIGSSTSLVVGSRRGSLARLALAGATPRQVRSTITVQLAVVSLLCAPLGDIIALIAVRPWIALMDYQARAEPSWVSLEPTIAWWPILLTNLWCVLVAVLAGRKQAKAASTIPPIEALRQSQAPPVRVRLRVGGWLTAILVAALVVVSFGSVPIQLEHRYKETVSNLIILGFAQVFIWGALLAVLAPILVRPVTRAWTRLIPSRSPAWHIARATVSARADRLYKSVVPVMFTFAIGVGSLTIVNSVIRTMAVSLGFLDLTLPMWDTFVLTFGLPLLIAFFGGVGSLLMMSKQRDAELALAGIVGATPTQRVVIPALEAVIITVTGALLSTVVIVPSLVFQAYSLTAAGLTHQLDLSAPLLIGSLLGGVVLTGLTTVLPTLPARHQPEPRVIARLIAE